MGTQSLIMPWSSVNGEWLDYVYLKVKLREKQSKLEHIDLSGCRAVFIYKATHYNFPKPNRITATTENPDLPPNNHKTFKTPIKEHTRSNGKKRLKQYNEKTLTHWTNQKMCNSSSSTLEWNNKSGARFH